MSLLAYYHSHLQDNVNASVVWAIPGYFWGRYRLNKIHHHIKKIHKHLGIK